jgi:hypothetical protein
LASCPRVTLYRSALDADELMHFQLSEKLWFDGESIEDGNDQAFVGEILDCNKGVSDCAQRAVIGFLDFAHRTGRASITFYPLTIVDKSER